MGNPATISVVSSILQIIVSFATVCTLLYGFSRFLKSPQEDIKARIFSLEQHMKDVDERLDKGDKLFAEQADSNRVTQKALLALLSHAINGNDTDSLKNAKQDLEDYLTHK